MREIDHMSLDLQLPSPIIHTEILQIKFLPAYSPFPFLSLSIIVRHRNPYRFSKISQVSSSLLTYFSLSFPDNFRSPLHSSLHSDYCIIFNWTRWRLNHISWLWLLVQLLRVYSSYHPSRLSKIPIDSRSESSTPPMEEEETNLKISL